MAAEGDEGTAARPNVVVADVSSAVEGGRPVHPPQYPCYGGRAARKEQRRMSAVLKCYSRLMGASVLSAGRDAPALRQAGCPPLRKATDDPADENFLLRPLRQSKMMTLLAMENKFPLNQTGQTGCILTQSLSRVGTSRCDVPARGAAGGTNANERAGNCAAGRGADGAARHPYQGQCPDTPGQTLAQSRLRQEGSRQRSHPIRSAQEISA